VPPRRQLVGEPAAGASQVLVSTRSRGGRAVAMPLHDAVAMKVTTLIGRILYSLIFIFAAAGHFKPETIAYAASQGVPLASLAVPASGVLSLIGGLSIALGYRTRWGAWALVAFLVPVTLSLHNFWAVTDPMMRQMQVAMFMKNVALIGGALAFAAFGAGAYSLDARAERRAQIVGAATAVA
jgi:putative oxidoreductase